MTEDHWFDAFHKRLVRNASRRRMLRAAAATAMSFALSVVRGSQAARNRKKKKDKRKKKDKDKDKPDPKASCSKGTCGAVPEWIGVQTEIDFCEFVCGQCDGNDPREFCIVDRFKLDGTLTKVSKCCPEGQECCGGVCCGPSATGPGIRCCGGRCIDPDRDSDHCGACDNACPPGQTCREGACAGCAWSCCHANDSGTCVSARECCTDPCSTCVGGDSCLRWRDGVIGGFCEERPWTCGVVAPPCIVDGVVIACCGEGFVCTPTGCDRE